MEPVLEVTTKDDSGQEEPVEEEEKEVEVES